MRPAAPLLPLRPARRTTASRAPAAPGVGSPRAELRRRCSVVREVLRLVGVWDGRGREEEGGCCGALASGLGLSGGGGRARAPSSPFPRARWGCTRTDRTRRTSGTEPGPGGVRCYPGLHPGCRCGLFSCKGVLEDAGPGPAAVRLISIPKQVACKDK